jgi:hypothetical protein
MPMLAGREHRTPTWSRAKRDTFDAMDNRTTEETIDPRNTLERNWQKV